ncbi:MAG: phosphate signaling complex PhoU family protein [Wenzhouxiangella sp.]
MFKKIYQALASKTAVDQAFSQLTEMLEHSLWMFKRANEVLHSEIPAEDVHQAIYARDKEINELQRSIRRKVLRYLTINPGYDVAPCLALISVTKDAERIGDYCKNVYEVGRAYTEGFHIAKYHEPLTEIANQTIEMFTMVSEACKNGDEALAEQAIGRSRIIRRRCDRIIDELFADEEPMQIHEAVAYSLLARHYKRVAGHLSNISTAVVGQLDDMDFEPQSDDE